MTSAKKKKLRDAVADCGGNQEDLRALAQEIVAGLAQLSPGEGGDPLDVFVSELVLSAADQRRLAQRRQHQMECIAAAKARGVRFGRQPQPLPEGFEDAYAAWREGELSLNKAAEACGMTKTSFQRAVARRDEELTA